MFCNNITHPTGDIIVDSTGSIINDNIDYPDENIFLEPIKIMPKNPDVYSVNTPGKRIQFDNLIKNIPIYQSTENIQTDPYKFNFTNGINTKLQKHYGPTSELILRRQQVEKEYSDNDRSYRNDLIDNYKSYLRNGQQKYSKFGSGQGTI